MRIVLYSVLEDFCKEKTSRARHPRVFAEDIAIERSSQVSGRLRSETTAAITGKVGQLRLVAWRILQSERILGLSIQF